LPLSSPLSLRDALPIYFVSAKSGALIAFVHSLVAFLMLLPWIGELVGAMPYIALSVFLSLYAFLLGIFGVFIARLRWGCLIFPRDRRRTRLNARHVSTS